MITLSDLDYIGRKNMEKRALSGAAIGALGGAGIGALMQLARPRDKDRSMWKDMILSAITGAGLGAAGGFAYDNWKGNPFSPGASQPSSQSSSTGATIPQDNELLDSLIEESQDRYPVKDDKKQPVPPKPEAKPLPVVDEPPATGPQAGAAPVQPGQPQAVPGANPQQQAQSQNTQNGAQSQGDQAKKKSPTVSPPNLPEKDTAVYDAQIAKNPSQFYTRTEALQYMRQRGAVFVTDSNQIAPGEPFLVNQEYIDKNIAPEAGKTTVWGERYRETLAEAAKNHWIVMEDKNHRVIPFYEQPGTGILYPAKLNPLYDPEWGTGHGLSLWWNDAVDAVSGAAGAIVNSARNGLENVKRDLTPSGGKKQQPAAPTQPPPQKKPFRQSAVDAAKGLWGGAGDGLRAAWRDLGF